MAGLGMPDNVPQVQKAAGVQAGSPYNFRLEPRALVVQAPEELELNPIQGDPTPSIPSHDEFFIAQEAPAMFPDIALEQKAAMKAVEDDQLQRQIDAAQRTTMPKWLVVGGLLALGYFMLGGRK